MEMKSRKIKLQSSDKKVIKVDVEVVKCSATITTLLENVGLSGKGAGEDIIPLPTVPYPILQKIIVWAKHHKDDPVPAKEDDDNENKDNRTGEMSSWDADFLRIQNDTLYELVLAANYLDIKGLLEVGCMAVANKMKGKNAEEIRKLFGLKNDFTKEEENEIRKQNDWIDK